MFLLIILSIKEQNKFSLLKKMHGAILGESSPPSSKEMTEKSDGSAPKKLPYFGEGGEVEFVQRKEVEEEAESEEEALDDDFSLLITKWWPFRLLKTLNLVSNTT
jgi:hypothetical protein